MGDLSTPQGVKGLFAYALQKLDSINIFVANAGFAFILKKEEVNHNKYYDFYVARRAIFEFIESWYNRKRIHDAINDVTPHAAHESAAQEVELFVSTLLTQVQSLQ